MCRNTSARLSSLRKKSKSPWVNNKSSLFKREAAFILPFNQRADGLAKALDDATTKQIVVTIEDARLARRYERLRRG